MSKLEEIERRLAAEPDNLGLRVAYAGALRDEGRRAEAIEQYRAVAFAYRYQGRTQQAIAVCRGILELAPGDGRSLAMLSVLEGRAAAESQERQWDEETPLPRPVPYHVANPTMRQQRSTDPGVPPDEPPPRRGRSPTGTSRRGAVQPTRPTGIPRMDLPAGLANATVRMSTTRTGTALDDEDLSAELETRRIPQIPASDLDKISRPPPTVPIDRVASSDLSDLDELFTPPAPLGAVPASDFDDIATRPVVIESSEDEETMMRDRDDPTMPDRRLPGDD